MKLLNPTDEQLNAAFAEKVAGWRPSEQEIAAWQTWAQISGCDTSRDNAESTAKMCDRPHFCTSADAVLPWLESWAYVDISRDTDYNAGPWSCGVAKSTDSQFGKLYHGPGETLAHAVVVALLRANGVEVTFDSPNSP